MCALLHVERRAMISWPCAAPMLASSTASLTDRIVNRWLIKQGILILFNPLQLSTVAVADPQDRIVIICVYGNRKMYIASGYS